MSDSATMSRDGEYESAIAEATESAERALSEARLPIHILLTAQFGDINDNQEEMLTAAEAALDQIADELRTLRDLAETDHDGGRIGRDAVGVGTILHELQPQLREQAARAGVSLAVEIQPAMPTTNGTLAKIRDGIRIALMDEIRYAPPGTAVNVNAHTADDNIVIATCCSASRSATAALLLARRLLSAQGATLDQKDGNTIITFAAIGRAML